MWEILFRSLDLHCDLQCTVVSELALFDMFWVLFWCTLFFQFFVPLSGENSYDYIHLLACCRDKRWICSDSEGGSSSLVNFFCFILLFFDLMIKGFAGDFCWSLYFGWTWTWVALKWWRLMYILCCLVCLHITLSHRRYWFCRVCCCYRMSVSVNHWPVLWQTCRNVILKWHVKCQSNIRYMQGDHRCCGSSVLCIVCDLFHCWQWAGEWRDECCNVNQPRVATFC